MRVIRADSVDSPRGLEFVNIEPDHAEPYAILSHTWGGDEEEVTYSDVLNGLERRRPTFQTKVATTCRRALADGYQFVWIDTCCIDKGSSAELSEAINSMFQWYRKSAVCYALLSDVDRVDNIDEHDSSFAKARWFTRGFTLQELLAPPHVIFYSRYWIELGTKASLCNLLAIITKVDIEVLIGDRPIEAASIANRMGWAANRLTKRPEDMAYCLMGIFSVNMPLLYGEGSRAFIRLQEEIMKSSTDHSIFAWVDEKAPVDEMRGVLATSPAMFSSTAFIQPFRRWEKQEPYSMTNMGLSINLPVNQVTGGDGLFVACFDCPGLDLSEEHLFGIFLKKLDPSNEDMRFARVRASMACPVTVYQYAQKSHVYLSTNPSSQPATSLPVSMFSRPQIRLNHNPRWAGFALRSVTVYPGGHIYAALAPVDTTDWPVRSIYVRQGPNKISCAILVRQQSSQERFLVLVGTASDGLAMGYYVVNLDKSPLENIGEGLNGHMDDLPDVHELELSLRESHALGEKIWMGSVIFQLSGNMKGRDMELILNIRRDAALEKKLPAKSSTWNLRNKFSKMTERTNSG